MHAIVGCPGPFYATQSPSLSLVLCILARHLPKGLQIIGYARSKLTDESLREKIKPNLKGGSDEDRQQFLKACTYVAGSYDEAEGFQALTKSLKAREEGHKSVPIGRLFYLALPPSVYPQASPLISLLQTGLTFGIAGQQ